jgi:probable rRNA maturation factor
VSAAAPGAAAPLVDLVGRARFEVARDANLALWLERLLRELAPGATSFAVRFVGDRTMRQLNRVFRGKDSTTDVLSFPGGVSPEGRHLGDVVISVPQALRQARELGHGPAKELRLLLLHGVLHCLGHDHESDDGEMDRLERRLRRRFLPEA